jgi:Uma2 family endonuclease
MSVKTLLTAEEFLESPEVPGVRYELVRGELVEMPGTTARHGDVAAVFYELVKAFVRLHRLGRVYFDGVGYIVARDRDTVRVPDVSFVARHRIPEAGVPDTLVEVVSSGDREEKVLEKVGEYLAAGTRLVWVAWPKTQSISVHAADGTVVELGPDDELEGGDVLPGFRVRVADLFDIGD